MSAPFDPSTLRTKCPNCSVRGERSWASQCPFCKISLFGSSLSELCATLVVHGVEKHAHLAGQVVKR